jgi:hypothetical protein
VGIERGYNAEPWQGMGQGADACWDKRRDLRLVWVRLMSKHCRQMKRDEVLLDV